jgi:hypothetical protein
LAVQSQTWWVVVIGISRDSMAGIVSGFVRSQKSETSLP